MDTPKNRDATVDYRFECANVTSSWKVAHFSCEQRVNSCYRGKLLLIEEEAPLKAGSMMGRRVSLHISRGAQLHSFGGIVERMEHLGNQLGHSLLRLEFVPALALCQQKCGARVFQEQTALEIVQALLSPTLSAYGSRLEIGDRARGQVPLDFRMQYDESDLAFAKRILAQAGINFVFRYDHDAEAERVHLFDHLVSLPPAMNLDGASSFPYHPFEGVLPELETIQAFSLVQSLVGAKVQGAHWDWRLPALHTHQAKGPQAIDALSSFDPKQYREDPAQLKARVQDQMTRQVSQRRSASGKSSGLGLGVATQFELEEHPDEELNASYVVTQTHHCGTCLDVGLSGEDLLPWIKPGPRFECRFFCVPHSSEFLPAVEAAHSRILGPMTALVCGPKSGEVHVDDHGRIRLRFHWDRHTPDQSPGSCWVRVAQGWAGDGFGTNFLPRVGTEVVVEFLHGDPEQPLVTGCVPNPATASPFTLPKHKYQSGIRTQSSDGQLGFNELRFDDERGQEEVYLHAQNALTLEVQGNKVQRVAGAHVQMHGADEQLQVQGDRLVQIGGRQSVQIHGPLREELGDSLVQDIGPNGWRATVQGELALQSRGVQSMNADKGFEWRSGQGGARLEVARRLKILARDLEIECGASTLNIDQKGAVSLHAKGQTVCIQGAKIKLNSK